jgi:hypothetical protein
MHVEFLTTMWEALGEPSKISGATITGLLVLYKYMRSKLSEINSLDQKIANLEIKLNDLDRLLSTRIDDLKK